MICHACNEQIETDSRFCRLCGAAQTQKIPDPAGSVPTSAAATENPSSAKPLWIIGGLAVLACFIALAFAMTAGGDRPPPSTDLAANLAVDNALADLSPPVPAADVPRVVEAPPPPPAEPWAYSTTEDKVRGAKSYFASTTSTNSVELDAPYDGGSNLRMTVRHSPAHGPDVILRLSSGQLLCRAYDGCYSTVRFDDEPAERIELVESSDNSSDTVFVSEARPFIAKLRKAKKVIVELEIYEAGRPQFEFDIAGLKWDH